MTAMPPDTSIIAPVRGWTAEQMTALYAHYPNGGWQAVAAAAPGKSRYQIQMMASNRGIKYTDYRTASKYQWTPEIEDEIRRVYREYIYGGMKRLSTKTGIPIGAIKSRGRRLGLSFCKWVPNDSYNRPWNDEELDILGDSAECPITYIQRKLKRAGYTRSSSAIIGTLTQTKARQYRTEVVFAATVAKWLGVDAHTVTRWINKRMLEAKKISAYAEDTTEKSCWHIERASLRRFLLEYRQYWDMKKVENHAEILDIIYPIRIKKTINDAPPC